MINLFGEKAGACSPGVLFFRRKKTGSEKQRVNSVSRIREEKRTSKISRSPFFEN